jgi:phosphoribosyl-AMP cyclohydrolase
MKKFSKEEIEVLLNKLDFSKIEGNLIPVITQDHQTNEVLMLAFANRIAIENLMKTGFAHYYSRSRKTIWKKGETSGNVQEIKELLIDCDNDSILIKVKQVGAACHEGYYSCFHKEYTDGQFRIKDNQLFDPKDVYK